MPTQRYQILKGTLRRLETREGLPVPPRPLDVVRRRYVPGDEITMTPDSAEVFGIQYLLLIPDSAAPQEQTPEGEHEPEPSPEPSAEAPPPEPETEEENAPEPAPTHLVQLAPTVVPFWSGDLIYSANFEWPGTPGAALPAAATGGEARFLGGAWGTEGTVRWNTQLRTSPPEPGEQKTVVVTLGDDIIVEWELTRAAHP